MFRFLVNLITTGLVFFNTYSQFKVKKEDKSFTKVYNIYFKVMSVYLVLDNLLSFILRMIPFYQLFKLLLVVWLSVPKCSGSVFVYRFYVNGLMRTYEHDLDTLLEKLKFFIVDNFQKYKDYAYGKIKEKREAYKSKKNNNLQDVGDISDIDINDVIKGEIEGGECETNNNNNGSTKYMNGSSINTNGLVHNTNLSSFNSNVSTNGKS